MHGVDQRGNVVGRRRGHETVSQVEDIPRSGPRCLDDRANRALDACPIGEQRHRIEIALEGDTGTVAAARLAEIRRPIEAETRGAGIRQRLERSVRALAEDDRGNRSRSGATGHQ